MLRLYFPSKKDFVLDLIFWFTIIGCFLPLLEREYIVLIFTLPIAIMLVWLWFSTGYEVSGDLLIIRSGPFKKSIPIKDINKITQTNNLMASFALSLDRLEITYGSKFGMVVVSPKDKVGFVSLLKRSNPRIKVDEKIN